MTMTAELPEKPQTYAPGRHPNSIASLILLEKGTASEKVKGFYAAKRARSAAKALNFGEQFQIEEVKKQIKRVLQWMDRTKNKEEHAKLASTLDKLWSKAYPTQAAQKSRPRSSQSTAQPLPSDAIQEPTQAQEL
jgi:DNA topoisomerase VI subunit B